MALVQAAQDPDEWRYVEMAKEYMGDHPNDHPNDNPTDTDKIGMAEALNVSGQQDVTECIENVLFQIECALEGHGRDADGEQEDLVKDLFYGKTSQSLHDPETGSLFGASKTERFLMLIVSLAGYGNGLSVYDVLDNYFEDAVVDLGSRKAIRRVAATQFPPVLQLQLQRVQFDARARRVYKSIAQVRLADRIFVDQYLDTPAALAHKQEAAAWRARLAAARSELAAATQRSAAGTALLDTLLTAHSILSRSQRVSPATLSFLARHTTELRIRLDTLKQTAAALEQQLATQRGLAQTQPYRLHAVFVHRGQASFGHYWVYIRDFEKDLFRKYNDKSVAVAEVTEVTGEVIEDPQATAYFVTYVKEDMVDKVVQVQ